MINAMGGGGGTYIDFLSLPYIIIFTVHIA